MLDLAEWYKKASWVVLVVLALTPFVFHPVLTMLLHKQTVTVYKQTSARPLSHHKIGGGISQTREKDPESKRSFELLSKANPAPGPLGLSNQPVLVLSHSAPRPNDPHCPTFLRI